MTQRKMMKTNEAKIAELEDQIKRQNRLLEMLYKKISYLERENARRRNDMDKIKHERN